MKTWSISYPHDTASASHPKDPTTVEADRVMIGQTGDALFIKDRADIVRPGPQAEGPPGELVAIIRIFAEIRAVDGTSSLLSRK